MTIDKSLEIINEQLGTHRIVIVKSSPYDPVHIDETYLCIRDKSTNASIVLKFYDGDVLSVERYSKQPEGVVGKPELLWSRS